MNRHFFALAAALAVLTAPALAADPCTLITKAEAAKALGGAVTGGHRGDECTYRLAGTGYNVYVATGDGPKAAAYFNAFKGSAKPVPGLGAPAYFSSGTVAVMKGRTLLQVGLITSIADMRTMNPKLPALVKTVLGRL